MCTCDCNNDLVSWGPKRGRGRHPASSLHIYTFVVSHALMVGSVGQAGDAGSSRAPGLASGLRESVDVHCGALLLVPR